MARLTREQYDACLRHTQLLVMDVDGVLTDGSIYYGDGEWEGKQFNVRDGSAMYIARSIGLRTAVITGRTSAAVTRRFRELPVAEVRQGTLGKLQACLEIQQKLGVEDLGVAYIGDDLLDLPLIEHAGVGIAVADSHELLKPQADWVTTAVGGAGALREVVDDIVTAWGMWDQVLADYRERGDRGH